MLTLTPNPYRQEIQVVIHAVSRRQFLRTASAVTVAGATATALPRGGWAAAPAAGQPPFKISLAQWSLHTSLFDGKIDHLDFAQTAKEQFGIEAVEYVNQFFMEKATDSAYLEQMRKRAEDHGVKSLLIMCDREGNLGDPDEGKRKQAVQNHHKWVEAAKFLGCHSIRVNAASSGSYDEQQKLAADGLRQLSEFAAPLGLNVIVENHGGLSSNGQWLAGVMKLVALDNCGTLPDFGNFTIRRGDNPEQYDRYKGVKELMPYAKAVSAKTYDFDSQGNETTIDYPRMMGIVLDHDYHGYVGIEYEGKKLSEAEGIKKSKALLERIASQKS